MPIGLVGKVVGAELDAARHLLRAFERGGHDDRELA
jgi:hypothetical protein